MSYCVSPNTCLTSEWHIRYAFNGFIEISYLPLTYCFLHCILLSACALEHVDLKNSALYKLLYINK